MSFHIIPLLAIYHVISIHTITNHAMSFHIIQFQIIVIISYHSESFHVMSLQITPYHPISYHILPPIMPYDSISIQFSHAFFFPYNNAPIQITPCHFHVITMSLPSGFVLQIFLRRFKVVSRIFQ